MQLSVFLACVGLLVVAVHCKPHPRTNISCSLGGDLACKAACFATNGHFNGACDENNDCICEDSSYYSGKNERDLVQACLLLHGECTDDSACARGAHDTMLCGTGKTCCFYE